MLVSMRLVCTYDLKLSKTSYFERTLRLSCTSFLTLTTLLTWILKDISRRTHCYTFKCVAVISSTNVFYSCITSKLIREFLQGVSFIRCSLEKAPHLLNGSASSVRQDFSSVISFAQCHK